MKNPTSRFYLGKKDIWELLPINKVTPGYLRSKILKEVNLSLRDVLDVMINGQAHELKVQIENLKKTITSYNRMREIIQNGEGRKGKKESRHKNIFTEKTS